MATRKRPVRQPRKKKNVMTVMGKLPPPRKAPPRKTMAPPTPAQEKAKLLAQARADVRLVQKKTAEVKAAFYDMGEALARLKVPAVFEALGFDRFSDLVAEKFEISPTLASQLIQIATSLPRETAVAQGKSHALALVRLCRAKPNLGAPGEVATMKLPLPSGDVLDMTTASISAKLDAAAQFRRVQKKPPRGNTVSRDDQTAAQDHQRRLRVAGLPAAKVRAIASRSSPVALLTISGVPVSEVHRICVALCH